MGASAWAVTRQDAGKVTCAVAEQRHGFTVQCGQYQFSKLTLGYGLQGFGIKYLYDIVVLPDVHSVLLLALYGYAGTAHLAHTEVVVGLGAPNLLNTLALCL